MGFRLPAVALLALACQGCYRPMYNQPYGYSSQGYPVGAYPGPIQTQQMGTPYVPGSSIPPSGMMSNPTPMNGTPTYSPGTTPPSARRPVPMYPEATATPPTTGFVQPETTTGGRELGYTPDRGLMPAGGEFSSNPPASFPAPSAAPMPSTPNFNAGNETGGSFN